ncbi:NAD(P)-binding protein [Apiospora kogelbergensis]|uniref:NAD(P)-binding protein n=1 Tax=Apiospora kogelbergensis TaxID=1337665 RepID=A0AAW0REP5_9PEZI
MSHSFEARSVTTKDDDASEVLQTVPTSRTDLTARVLPQMKLGDGNMPGSLAAPPPPLPASATPAARAAGRFRVEGNAIVTGGAGDLGFAASRALLEHGLAGLVLFDTNAAEGAAKARTLQAEFPHARVGFVRVDVTDAAAVDAAVADAAATLGGGIDVLVAFAGVVACQHAAETTAEDWRRVLDVNTTGGGVLALAKSLAAEWAAHGIRVNSVSPGYMDTVLNEGVGLDAAKNVWLSRNPMRRMGRPDELAGAVVLLASRAGSYINGADILVDGGQTVF